ncbi:transposase [Streptomyces sp. NBC_00654]|nr:Tn3 family transposase [Streptomyces sp. NBC_00654]MCX4966912.1 transposase [Streptomyces sp. NBC_00654]
MPRERTLKEVATDLNVAARRCGRGCAMPTVVQDDRHRYRLYSDIVFELLALAGVTYTPLLAALPDQKMWRIDRAAGYGAFQDVACGRVDLGRIERNREDIVRIIGSIHTGAVLAYDVTRMLSREGRPTPLGNAIAHYGRIAKALHILRLADEPGCCRQIKGQANLQECRHALARKFFRGRFWQLYQRYQDGRESLLTELPGREPTSPRRSTHGDGTKRRAGQLASEAVPHRLLMCCHHELLGTTTACGGSGARGHAVTGRHGSHGPEGRPG